MTVGLAAAFVLARLRCSKDETAVFDGAGAHQHVPMRLAGRLGEGGGNGQHGGAGLGQCAVEGGKTQVVADRQSQHAPRQIADHGLFAGAIAARLAIALAIAEVDVEHMDLVVARGDVALRRDEKPAVSGLVG